MFSHSLVAYYKHITHTLGWLTSGILRTHLGCLLHAHYTHTLGWLTTGIIHTHLGDLLQTQCTLVGIYSMVAIPA